MTSGPPPPRPSTARTSAPPVAAMRSLARPKQITAAFWLWQLAAGFAIASAVVAIGRLDGLRDEFVREARENDGSASAGTVDRVADLSVLIVVGGGLLIGVLAVLFAAAMWVGKGWARGALVLVALLAVAYAVLVAVPLGWLVLAAACLAVVATVCMYLPGSKPWFV
ncbi:MAG: hypothetical protein WBA97_20720 [Actinophytocola sp.]|uniref:hypothetical protein n=1 Tax=Actinophytocola sp. TaxID=1872138 RepID=UPI003C7425B2